MDPLLGEPVKIFFDGIFYGETTREDLKRIRARYKADTSVLFSLIYQGLLRTPRVYGTSIGGKEEGIEKEVIIKSGVEVKEREPEEELEEEESEEE